MFIRVALLNILQSFEKTSLYNIPRPHQKISLKPIPQLLEHNVKLENFGHLNGRMSVIHPTGKVKT